MNIADELERLDRLRQSGSLSEEEYQKAKDALLRQSEPLSQKLNQALDSVTKDSNLWGLFLHLSQFLGYAVPFLGLVVPIIIWQVKKEDPILDRHGRIVCNWILSSLLYWGVGFLLTFVIIGIPLLIVLAALCIIFPIVGGIKANSGEVWPYPMSIRFLSV